MAFDRQISRGFALDVALLAAALLAAPAGAWAQTSAPLPGFSIEIEGQRVFGASDFDAGLVPDLSPSGFHVLERDEGEGWGGALALGYTWANGWNAAVRYRRLEADTGGGPMEPIVIPFVPSLDLVPGSGGFPFPLADVLTRVESSASLLDLLASKDIPGGAGRLELFGGLTYATIDRDISLIDCSCTGLAVHYSSTFEGIGPKVGFRGGIPISGGVHLVGGGSAAVLFGTSEFKNSMSQPDGFGLDVVPFKDKGSRTVGAFDAEAGLAFALGAGTFTLGYRIDAWLQALDSDQRVSEDMLAVVPPIGDRHDDFVEHGPFVRFAMPLAGVGN
jgi:hypothetical protein